jgi:uncharacterized protein (UPF0548 family)
MTEPLPREWPGPPVEGGTWEVARRLMLEYQMADPARVRTTYRPGAALAGRDMLLTVRFAGLRLRAGVRVGEVYDEFRSVDRREARVFGWDYATLEGHFEAGRMDYEVRKWLDTGEVDFRIHAYSRTAHIANPVVRLGFRLFGRKKQTQFARHACERMRRLTERELARHGQARSEEEDHRAGGPGGARHRPDFTSGDGGRLEGPRTGGGLVVRPTAAR